MIEDRKTAFDKIYAHVKRDKMVFVQNDYMHSFRKSALGPKKALFLPTLLSIYLQQFVKVPLIIIVSKTLIYLFKNHLAPVYKI